MLTSKAANSIARREQRAELQASEIRYRRLFEAARDGILLLNSESGNIEDVNPFMCELLAMSREEFIGKPLWELGPLRDIIANQIAFQELKKKGYIRYEHLPLETKAGKQVHVEFVSNVYLAAGQSVIQCNIRDISERYHAEQALRKSEEQLRHSQKMDAFGQLAAGMAHDFNNLLTVINGYAELLAGRLPQESPLRTDLDEIARAGQRASLLTRQLLAFSRKQVVEARVLDLNAIVMETDRILGRVIGEDIEIVKKLGPELWSIKIDPGQMEQVILNLAVNARDAMPSGGKLVLKTANIELDGSLKGLRPSARPGPHVVLTVADTGTGMSVESMAHLFEPFFTTKEPGKGTGLGLATVYGIVQQAKGSIGVESEPGKGSTIKIYFPRAEEAATGVSIRKPIPATLRGHETLLLAEDEDSVRKLAHHILVGNGYTVLDAASGPEAIALSENHAGTIDLLLSDMVMPGMSGTELSAHISKARPTIKTLFMSGYSSEAVARHGHLKPGAEFLQKPYTPAEMTTKIRAVLDDK